MPENSKIKDLNYYISWFDYSISEEHIKYYEYSDFTNIQHIGKGSYGNVVRVNWKTSNRLFALKSFNNNKQTLKEVAKELKLIRSVDDHENVIRFYGITKMEDTSYQTNKHSLVLEYANKGTLNTYLNEEEIIDGTPVEYNKLYTECWKYEPSERPNIQEVVSALKAVIYPNQNDTIVYKINEKKEPEKFKSASNLCKKTIDINNDLIDVKSLNINEHESGVIVESENIPSTVSDKTGSSIDDTNYFRNQSSLKLENEEFINKICEKKEIEKYKTTSKLIKETVNNDLMDDDLGLNIDEYECKNEIIMESENNLSSASNQAAKPSIKDMYIYGNQLLLRLENEGFITPDEKNV
ncbi:unnamed protein product [Rhizophagus irregularis]|nr:unnamed protein product [Rhizophagus irregularis]